MKAHLGWAVGTSLLLLVACGKDSRLGESRGPQNLPGSRNDALRAASAEHGVPLDLLMALAYQQGRLEAPAMEEPAAPAALPIKSKWTLGEGVRADGIDPNDPAAFDTRAEGNPHVDAAAYGVMHLGPAQLRDAADRLGRPEAEVAQSISLNVEGAAALIKAHAVALAGSAPLSDEVFERATLKLLGLEDGDAARLALQDIRELRRYGFDVTTSDGERVALVGETRPLQVRQALTAGEYPTIEFIAAANGNYEAGRGGKAVNLIVIHDMEGTLVSMIQVFKTPGRVASAHYGIDPRGRVVQMVSEANTAYHCGNFALNQASIGIEHEGYAGFPDGAASSTAPGNYSKEYPVSAGLTCAIAKKYNIPVDRQHITGHGNIPKSGTTFCSDAAGYSGTAGCGGASGHTDPGKYWEWAKFMDLVAKCVAESKNPTTPTPTVDAGTVTPPATETGTDAGIVETPGSELPIDTGTTPPPASNPGTVLPPSTPSVTQHSKEADAAVGCSSVSVPASVLALCAAALALSRARRTRKS